MFEAWYAYRYADTESTLPTGPKGQKRPADVIGNAVKVMRIATEQEPETDPTAGKNPTAVALGKLGGAKGGKARASSLFGRAARDRFAGGGCSMGEEGSLAAGSGAIKVRCPHRISSVAVFTNASIRPIAMTWKGVISVRAMTPPYGFPFSFA
jgi:hypothetical protein